MAKYSIQEAMIERKAVQSSLESTMEEIQNETNVDKNTLNNAIQAIESATKKGKLIQSLVQKANTVNKVSLKDGEEIAVIDLIKRKESNTQIVEQLASLKQHIKYSLQRLQNSTNSSNSSLDLQMIEDQKTKIKENILFISEKISSLTRDNRYYQAVIERSNWEYSIEF